MFTGDFEFDERMHGISIDSNSLTLYTGSGMLTFIGDLISISIDRLEEPNIFVAMHEYGP